MKIRLLAVALAVLTLTGCSGLARLLCTNCRSDEHTSSSLVEFLYPDGKTPPREDAMPELRLPLRVGLAFLPNQQGADNSGLDAARKEELMGRIRKRFADRSFVADIVVIPEYYLANRTGFAGLEGVQRLYSADLLALVSYDQQTHLDDNEWSLSYLTIVGAYVVKGSRNDISTLVDLAVIDPATRSLVLRAGGTDTQHRNTTLVAQQRETRAASGAGFDAATGQMIENFDFALTKFQEEVRAGTAPVRIVKREARSSGSSGGGGAFDWWTLLVVAGFGLGRRALWGLRAHSA